jgi:uncharacterized protein
MRKLALITGASTGIGYELACIAAKDGYDLLVAANEERIHSARADFQRFGVEVIAAQVELSELSGVDELLSQTGGRSIDVLCANAGVGTGGAFLEQEVEDWIQSVNTNITGTIYLVQKVLRQMLDGQGGRILVTGSIAGYIPGSYNAVYNGTKAFVDNFTDALRNEIKDMTTVSLTTLMPGATETEFFERADMLDTKVGASDDKADAADVAQAGWDGLMKGEHRVIPGLGNKLQVAAAGVVPPEVLAEQHRKMAEPGSADRGQTR